MAGRKFDLTVPVDWQSILKLFRWRLGVLIRNVEYLVRCYHCDQVHCYPEFLDYHLSSAFFAFDEFFDFLVMFNQLRLFLCLKPCTPESLGILELLNFYDVHFWDSLEIGNVPRPAGNIYFYPD